MKSQELSEQMGRKLCDILENYSEQALRGLFDKDIILWHNFTNREIKGEEVFSFTTATFKSSKSLKYTDLRCMPTARGWVQQHLVRSEQDGRVIADIPACLVVTSADHRIQRIEEYVDMSRMAGFVEAMDADRLPADLPA
jgi:hypothetical protein